MLTDTHCHLNLNSFDDDLPAVLERAWTVGVERILIPGIDLESSRRAVELCALDARLFAAVGVHPSDAAGWNSSTLDELRSLARSPRVVAIGEIGLDYYRDRVPRDFQKQVFQAQLDLAQELSLPVVIHNRDSWDDLWPILSAWQTRLQASANSLAALPGVLHSFDGTLEQAGTAVNQFFKLGLSGPVTYKNAAAKHLLAASFPLDCFLLETDAPFLTPHPLRGQRNEPAFTSWIASAIAALRKEELQDVTAGLKRNAAQLFHWEFSN